MLGTTDIAGILELFAAHGITDKRFRRLFCESGPLARGIWMQSNEQTRGLVEESMKGFQTSPKYSIKANTFVLVFESLAKLREDSLIRLLYQKGGGNAHRAMGYCSPANLRHVQGALKRTKAGESATPKHGQSCQGSP